MADTYLFNRMILFNRNATNRLTVSRMKRYRQKKQILWLLYEQSALTASDLSKGIHVSLPTTKTLVDELIELKMVRVSGIGESRGGRKPALYCLVEDAFYVIAVSMGHYKAKVTLFNCKNVEVAPVALVETTIDDPELEDKLYRTSMRQIQEHHIPLDRVAAMGVNMPGLVDSNLGINYFIKDKSLYRIGARLKKKFGMEVYVDNDARMQAFGELKFGKARDKTNVIVLNWSWGLGVGMILNGMLYSGSTGFAGELSHIKVQEDGDLCHCGKRGCLETMASARTLIKYAREGIAKGAVSQLTTQFKDDPQIMRPEDVVNAAMSGDEFSIAILTKVGTAFGRGLSMLIQIMNPEVIVLGGSLAKANQYVMVPIQQSLNQYCLEKVLGSFRIEISDIDEHSGLMGLSSMLFQRVFSKE